MNQISPQPQPLSIDEGMSVQITMRVGDWQRVLWALGKQPLETVLSMYNQIQAQVIQAAMTNKPVEETAKSE